MTTNHISEVQIGNLALSHLGTRSLITSLTENSNEAAAINLWYTFSRRQALAKAHWSFARKRVTLSSHADDPPENIWAYRYQYPADCVEARKLENEYIDKDGDNIPYVIEMDDTEDSRSILTDMDEAVLVYTFDQTNPETYPPHFVLALSHLLASHIAMQVTGKKTLKDSEYEQYLITMSMAEAEDARQDKRPPPRDAAWIRGRE